MMGYLQKIKDVFKNVIEFIKDTRKELHNVSWPTRRELVSTTMVVIVAVFFFGFFLWVVDLIVQSTMGYVFNRILH
jgi:preprotein translocase subunit SecE